MQDLTKPLRFDPRSFDSAVIVEDDNGFVAVIHLTCRKEHVMSPRMIMSVVLVLLSSTLFIQYPSAASQVPGSRPAERGADRVFTDPLNQISLLLPTGWCGTPPAADAIEGISTITNYTEEDVRTNVLDQEGWLPPEALKIQIMSEPIRAGISLEELTNESVAQEMTPNTIGHTLEVEALVSELWSYDLAGYKGYITIIDHPPYPPSLLIQLQVDQDRSIRLGLTPATSESLDEGLRIASTLSTSGQSIDLQRSNLPMELPAPLRDELLTRTPLVPTAVQGTCPSGTFPGNEAPAVPATLHMPFRAGEYWRVGDQGSYFGNGAHCNSNNDYYATDWNRSNSIGQYQSDYGYHVLPVANGTVTYSVCTTTGYGCHIKIVHDLDGMQEMIMRLSTPTSAHGVSMQGAM